MINSNSESYKYVIDSSAWIEYLRGTAKGRKVADIIENKLIATSIISIAEIADKFEKDNCDFSPALRFILSRSNIIQLTINICLKAAKIKKLLRVKNKKFGLADAILLMTAQQEKTVLITTDYDFQGINNVIIVS